MTDDQPQLQPQPEPQSQPQPEPPSASPPAPQPRRTRRGEILVGPSVLSRWGPLAGIGLPIISLILAPLGTAGLQQLLLIDGIRTLAPSWLLASTWAQGVLAYLALWALLAGWALVPMALTRRIVLLDPAEGTVRRRRGLGRPSPARPVADVVWAVGDADRDASALIGLYPGGPDAAAAAHADAEDVEQWGVGHIGWDDAAFDGLRALQDAAGLAPAPPRPVLVARERRERHAAANRELARRVGMPWREEYADDRAAFQRDFDRARRVLGGREPGR